jgi:5'-nucleotidase
MRILLTNDDGIHAEGLWALYRRMITVHEVSVVAPDRERSAIGHGITLHTPLRIEKVRREGIDRCFSVNGTPADCVKLGLSEILEEKPDIVISGINPGANVGVNVHYSGTVAAAKEASLLGVPAIAVSVNSRSPVHYDQAARFAQTLAAKVINIGLPHGTILNVNLPDLPLEEMAGIRVSRQGIHFFSDFFEKRLDPRNMPYYWQACEVPHPGQNLELDSAALCANYITITPIRCDMTDDAFLDTLKPWEKNGHHMLENS